MIRHAALFTLKHSAGSSEEEGFIKAIRELGVIPGVLKFELSREVSPKNAYAFAVSMYFANQAAYDGYNSHPSHVSFVKERWLPEVADFMEHDTIAI